MEFATLLEIVGFTEIFVAAATGYLMYLIRRHEKKSEARAEARKQESLHMIEWIAGVGDLSEAIAIAQKRGEPNGETDKALDNYKKRQEQMHKFLNEQAVSNYK